MAYDVDVADRLREILAAEPGVTEQKMFGGLAFMVAGHMAVAASGQGGILLRADPDDAQGLLADPLASPFVMGKREKTGWLRVDLDADTSDGEFERWVRVGVDYVRSLPPK